MERITRSISTKMCHIKFRLSFIICVPTAVTTLVQGLSKYDGKNLTCMAATSELYVSVTLDNLRFVDSLQFLHMSLETLVDNLFKSGSDILVLRQRSVKHFNLLVRKGIYPNEYVDSFTRFDEASLTARKNIVNSVAGIDNFGRK